MNFKEFLKLDEYLSRKLRIAEKPGTTRTIAAILAHSGDSWFWMLGIIPLWKLGPPYWKPRALILGIGIIITAIIVMTIKFSVRRSRPDGEWGSIYRTTDPHSFPSGHAARAFMLATVTWGIGPAWLAILLLIWAPCVSIARIAMGVHYISDVTAGSLFGIILGIALTIVLKPILLFP